MKYKATKTHLVFKLTRTEFRRISNIIDLGLCDVNETLNGAYTKDADIAESFMTVNTEADREPKFKKVE